MAKKNVINVDVVLSEKDYLHFNMINSMKMIIGFVVYAVVFLFVISRSGFYGEISDAGELAGNLAKPLIMFLLFMAFYVGFIYYKSQKAFAKYPMIRQPHHYQLNKNTIIVKTDNGEAKVKMDQVHQIVETKKMFIVYSSKSRAHLITKSSFANESSYIVMKELFRESVVKKKLKLKKN